MKLEVKKTKRRRANSTEAAFEKRFATALSKQGRVSYHTAEKFIEGIPDRYTCGGIWIEFKVVPYSGKRRINLLRYFSPAQKLWMTRLENGGDIVYGCVLLQPENGDPRIVLQSWHTLKNIGPMTPDELTIMSFDESNIDMLAKSL